MEENLLNKTFTEIFDQTKIVVGDERSAVSFKPHVEMQFWGEDSFCLESLTATGVSSIVDKVAYFESDMLKQEWYKDGEYFKWIFNLKSKPASNVYTLNFGGDWASFDFHYQTPLKNPEYYDVNGVEWVRSLDDHARRPRDVDGSYAVYHKTKCHDIIGGKSYKTGKACHIMVPRATDAKGVVSLCTLNIINSVYTVTIDSDFLAQATYPVRINDTFGASGAGASIVPRGTNVHVLSGVTGISGTATSVSTAVDDGNGQNCTMGVYSGASNPLTLEESTGEVVLTNNVDAVYSSDLDSPLTLDSGTTYYPASHWAGTIDVRYDASTNASDRVAGSYVSGEMPTPISPTIDETWQYSIWVTYTPSGGGISIPVVMNHLRNQGIS